jgi:hypothetical protein
VQPDFGASQGSFGRLQRVDESHANNPSFEKSQTTLCPESKSQNKATL